VLTLNEVLSDFATSASFNRVDALDVNSIASDGSTPLHFMAYLGDVLGTSLLLQAGANINAIDVHGNTALHKAVISHQHLVVKQLVSNGALGYIKNKQGFTPLEVAINDKYKPTIEVLQNAP
jgi:ankyrin repeat protein